MKKLLNSLLFIGTLQMVDCHQAKGQLYQSSTKKQSNIVTNKVVTIACGQCQFKMHGNGCTLAIKINNTPYFVKGASIDSFGDAHANTGFCNAISKAIVSGYLQDSIFIANKIKLLQH